MAESPDNLSKEPRPVPPREMEIGRYRTPRLAHEAGLAILAAGHSYRIMPLDEGGYALLVDEAQAARMQNEVAYAARRNRFWPPSPLELPSRSVSKIPTLCVAALLLLMHWATQAYPWLKEVGRNSSAATLQQGELWRLVTAITLHADLGHLAGNLLGISFFAYLTCRYMGNGLGWLLILAAAALSNLTSVLLQARADYHSLGASTAVFAALGFLAGFPLGCYLRTRQPLAKRDWLIPFFGGCVFFAWMGGGDFPTDVGAHLWSFAYGIALSALVGRTALQNTLSPLHQRAVLGAAAATVAGAWAFALSAGPR